MQLKSKIKSSKISDQHQPVDGEQNVRDGRHDMDECGEPPPSGVGACERVLHVHRLVEVEEHARHRAHEEHPNDTHEEQRQPVLNDEGKLKNPPRSFS